MGNAQSEDITTQLTIGVQYGVDGPSEQKTIYPIAEGDLEQYCSLGRGSVEFPGHAIHMAFRFVPDFFERVAGYRLLRDAFDERFEDAVGHPYASIEFFEETRATSHALRPGVINSSSERR